MEAIPIVLIVFGAITAWTLGPKYLKLRHEERLLRLKGGGEPRHALVAERDELRQRLDHLEAIVCNVDFELNAKLSRLATHQLALPAPVAAVAPPAVADAPPVVDTQAFYCGKVAEGARIAKRFVIRSVLGEGGVGAVYEAFDETLGETVALKVIRDSHLAHPDTLARFRREVSLARSIQHPNVVRIHDIGEEGPLLFLTMQRARGTRLRDIIAKEAPLPQSRVRTLLDGVLSALEACHEQDIVHRDIKPENIIVSANDVPVIIDFGLARLDAVGSLTATQAIFGTPHYMAPEQCRGEHVDARADLYAVAILGYEMLTGQPPFSGNSAISLIFAHCSHPPAPLPAESAAVWQTFLFKALEKQPMRRYTSAQQMRAALQKLEINHI